MPEKMPEKPSLPSVNEPRIDIGALPGHTFAESERMREHGAHVENEPMLQNGVSRERLPSGFDELSIHPGRYAQIGHNPETHALGWKKDPRVWNGPDNAIGDLDNWLEITGGRQLFDTVDGSKRPIKKGDLILCEYPLAFQRAYEAQLLREQHDFIHNTQDTDGEVTGPDGDVIPRWREGSRQELDEMGRSEHEASIAAGFVGEYQGVSFQRVMELIGREEWQAMEDRHRGGRRIEENFDTQEAARARDNQRQQRGSGGKFVSIPNNVRPRNFAGAKK